MATCSDGTFSACACLGDDAQVSDGEPLADGSGSDGALLDGQPGTDATLDATTDVATDVTTGPITCQSDKECTASGQVCDPLTKFCVACLTDAECKVSEHCIGLTCQGYTPCSNSLGCKAAKGPDGLDQPICDQKIGECSSCLTAADCPASNDCVAKACVPFKTCQNSTECQKDEVCDKATNRCVQCLGNNDCATNQLCENGKCHGFVPCSSDKQCTQMGLLCDSSKGKCAQCLANGDCPGIYNCQKVGVDGTGFCVLDVCAQGQGACNNNQKVTCNSVGDGYGSPQTCGAGTTCVAPGGKPECKAWACTPGVSCDGDKLVTCTEDGLEVQKSEDCAASGGKCVAGACKPVICKPTESYCDGNVVKQCAADGLSGATTQTCKSSEFCDTGACKPQVCTPNQAGCDGNAVKTCNATGSGFLATAGTDCGAAKCFAGVCKALVCTPSDTYCDGKTVKACSVDGLSFTTVKTCGNSQFCAAGVCKAQVCTPGGSACDGSKPGTCNTDGSGVDTFGTDCATKNPAKVCVAGNCLAKICEPALQVCVGSSLNTCSPDGTAYSSTKACGVGYFCGANKLGDPACLPVVCDPGKATCNGTSSTTCNSDGSGYTGASTDCTSLTKVCSAGACVSLLCDPLNPLYCNGLDAMKCDATGLQPSKLQTCGAGYYCGSGACSKQICTPNSAASCAGNKPATCNADGSAYSTIGADCGVGKVCDAGVCLDQVCKPSLPYCDAGKVKLCAADGLSGLTTVTCSTSQYCDAASVTCKAQVCVPNAATCSGNKPATCNGDGSGFVGLGADCGVGKACDPTSGTCKAQVCGNGVVEGTEGCDAGGLNGGGACSATCSCVNVGCGGDLDSAWSNVVLLMHMDGAQGSKVFVDEKGHLPSVVGAAVVSQTPVPKFGTGALSTATGGSYLSLPASVDWSYGTADFTAEAWVYPTVAEVGFCMHSLVFHTSFHFSLLWDDCDTTGKGMVSLPGQNLYFSRPATVNQWQHLAVVRQSGSFGVFVDGGLTVEGWQPVVANITGMLPLYIGANPDAPNDMHFPGYIDEARITKGVARYTSNFTPTKSAFGAPGSVGVCTANTPTCLGNLAGTCNAAGTGLVSATDCAVSGKTCSAGLCASSFPSCKAALTANAAAADGVYAIDPDGAGPIEAANLFCDMTNGGLTLVANIYDSAGDDAPNDTSYVVSGWQQSGPDRFVSFSTGKNGQFLTQDAARQECQGRGGDLAWVTSAAENALASQACLGASGGTAGYKGCWIGGQKSGTSVTWLNGAATTYVNWSPGEPNGTGDTVWMYSSPSPGAGGWDDSSSVYATSFLCRLPLAGDVSGAAKSVAIAGWKDSVSKVDRDATGTGSAAVSLAFVAALKASAGQANLKMCFVHQNGTDTVCRNSADGSMTLVSFATGNPKLTVYSGDKLTYTFGRLAGLAGGVDGYDLSSDPGGAACVPKTPGQIGEFGTGPGICDHFGAVWPNYNGPVHYEGWGTTYAPVGVLNDELKGAAAADADAVANPNLNTYGFRLYIGP